MFGLGALTVLSLLWMARRVRRRGAFGRKASATLRSLYPIVLGLGGWFLGVLLVLTTMPGVPLDDDPRGPLGRRAGRARCLPGWVNGDWSGRTRTIGLVAASGGRSSAPGSGSTRDRPAGARHLDRRAVAGANLALIVLDISRAGSVSPVAAQPQPAGTIAEA